MKLVAISTLVCASVSLFPARAADEKPTTPSTETVKFVELKYLGTDSSDRLNRVITVIRQLTGGVQIIHDSVLRTTAIKGTPEGIASAEQLLKRFDTPAAESKTRQIQLSVYLVEASDQSSPDNRVPTELASAIEQLRTAFGYKSFRAVDTMVFQGRENAESYINGILPTPENAAALKTHYTARYKVIGYNEAQKAVFVQGFRFDLRIPIITSPPGVSPAQYSYTESGMGTDLTIKDGQKLVLGKLTKDQSERGVFLIVTAKVD